MSISNKQEKEQAKTINMAYKIKMVVEIEGEIEGQPPLKDETGIYPMIKWAAEDIERQLNGICDIVDVKAVELKEV